MKKITSFLILFLYSCSVYLVYSQETTKENNESNIVISESSMASLIALLQKHKLEKKINNQKNKPYLESSEQTSSTNENYELSNLNATNIQDYIFDDQKNQKRTYQKQYTSDKIELDRLEQQLAELKNSLKDVKDTNKSDLVAYTSTTKNSNAKSLINDTPNSSQIQPKQVDSVATAKISITPVNQINSEDLEAKIIALQLQMKQLQKRLENKSTPIASYTNLKDRFKGYTKEVFFDNGSFILSTAALLTINEVFANLEENDNVDVLLNGYASNVGSPNKNDKLSMERTEVVKKQLVHQGIHPIRIMTQYHGIDYKAANDTKARRVEISFIVRK